MSGRGVRFNDLVLDDEALARAVEDAIRRVIDSAWYVLGPEVAAFEKEFAGFVTAKHGVGVASGTDAISLALSALGVGPGDEVITSPLTAAFTALAVSRLGARPVFADVEEDALTLSPESVEAHVTARTKALLPVHLYGNPCDMAALSEIARRRGLVIVEDACQAHGALYRGQPVGSLGDAGAFSFYPTKNLGALGDGGFITTHDGALAAELARLRNGGQSSRYVHEALGVNSRLDEIQAAILRAKLPYLEGWNDKRRELARFYEIRLEPLPLEPVAVRAGSVTARHLFVVRAPRRADLMEYLKRRDIQTLIHYPVPAHLQPAYRGLEQKEGSCPVAEEAAASILSLPLHPAMTEEDVDAVVRAVTGFYET